MVRSLAILALVSAAFAAPLAQDLPVNLGKASAAAGSLGLGQRDVANVVASPVEAVVDAVAHVVPYIDAYGVVNAANVNIKDSKIADNIANDNDIHVLRRDALADIEATLYAVVNVLVNLCINAGVNVQALLANVKVSDSSILTNILNNNHIKVARDIADVDALIKAAVKALVLALVNLNVPVEAYLANINISYTDILDGILQYNNISVASRSAVDVFAIAHAIVQALIKACADVGVDIQAAIANIDLKYVNILTNVLNNNNIDILRRDVPQLANVVLDLLAYVTVLIDAAAKAQVNILAELLNIGIDCSSILSNIGNGNTISILSRDLLSGLLSVGVVVKALIQALLGVEADVAASILNVVVQHSSIASDILNDNVIHIL